jgi:type I restriction enzyme, S subunit
LLFVRVNGSKELVGRCAVFEDVGEPIAYNDHIIRVKLNDEIFPDYAKLITETKKVRDIIVEKASTSAGQLTINQETIGSIEIPLIPIDKQKKLVEDFSRKLKTANQLQQSLESQLAEINELPSALLRQAFAGEL